MNHRKRLTTYDLLTESPYSIASRPLVAEPLTADDWQQVYEAQRAFIVQVRMIVARARRRVAADRATPKEQP
jgi:hypothetical protein